LLVGAGADEILDLVAKTFIPHGGSAIVPIPTYPMYGILTDQRGATVIRVPRRPIEESFALDIEAIRAAVRDAEAWPGLIWLCNPNNPTATVEPPGTIEALVDGLLQDAAAADRTPPAILLDEAYIEFGGESALFLRHRYPRLVITRTMSKAYGIAGLRVGFALARPQTIDEIATYRPPGSVSIVSVDVAAALLPDERAMLDRVESTLAERRRFGDGLAEAGWNVHLSNTNFLLVSFDSPEVADVVADGLLRRGLIPRTFPAGHPLDHCIRLTVRNREQDDRLIAAAKEIAILIGTPPPVIPAAADFSGA
ncbi:MAG TPA: histidinol-phosphate transaminase, partial [Candidatus Limnocylindria bacterium]|nr:histidinol-phosphate transaminase [Candidatus Limnocylindria bacterium]